MSPSTLWKTGRLAKNYLPADEYDAPVNAALFSSAHGLYERIEALFSSSFFEILKDVVSRDTVVKCWLTGVLPVLCVCKSPLSATCIISVGISVPRSLRFHGCAGADDRRNVSIFLAGTA